VTITGGGSTDLGPKVAIPGAFKKTDPGYTANIYSGVSWRIVDRTRDLPRYSTLYGVLADNKFSSPAIPSQVHLLPLARHGTRLELYKKERYIVLEEDYKDDCK
jgi:hypothetical protein